MTGEAKGIKGDKIAAKPPPFKPSPDIFDVVGEGGSVADTDG
jgi:hypothetical protein